MEKTNAMRILDKYKITYKLHDYTSSGAISGTDVADALGESYARVFKTLVLQGKSKAYYVCIIPVDRELDLKVVANIVGEKSIEMLKSKDLLPLTGYIHGGCSPIGMKKYFATYIDKSAEQFNTIIFSGGKIGYQVELSVQDLAKVIKITLCELISKS